MAENVNKPNHFLAIRITNPTILKWVSDIQDAISSRDPRLEDARIPPARLHVTLCVMRLDSQDDILKATGVLAALEGDIATLLHPTKKLRFQSLGQFSNRVLISPPEHCAELLELEHMLRARLSEAGINITGTFCKYNPHMTIFKMDWTSMKEGGGRVHRGLYADFADSFIGEQPIDAIHLCAMGDLHVAREDGFYHCQASVDVNPGQ